MQSEIDLSEFKLGDILANAITHGIGAGLAIAGGVYLIVASTRGTVWHVVSCSIFAATLMLVYICSTLYHSLVRTGARHVFQILDHSSIYLLIAGTYTPFTLVSLRGRLGWWIFGVEWGLAAAGILSKSLAMERFKAGRLAILSAMVYLLQGWIIVFAIGPVFRAIGGQGIAWLGAGGVAYTLGIVFLRWIAGGTFMRRGMFLCWLGAWRTILRFCSTWSPRGSEQCAVRRYFPSELPTH